MFSQPTKPSNTISKEVKEQKHSLAASCYPDHVHFEKGVLQSLFGNNHIQYHFEDESTAKQCVEWLQSHKQLAEHDLSKLTVKKEKCVCDDGSKSCYIFQLTAKQFNALCEKGAYKKCSSLYATSSSSMYDRVDEILEDIKKIKVPYYYNMLFILRMSKKWNLMQEIFRLYYYRDREMGLVERMDDSLFCKLFRICSSDIFSRYLEYGDDYKITQMILNKLDTDTFKYVFINQKKLIYFANHRDFHGPGDLRKSMAMVLDRLGIDGLKECLAQAGPEAINIIFKLPEDRLLSLLKNSDDDICCQWMPDPAIYFNQMAQQLSPSVFSILISKIDKILSTCTFYSSYIENVAKYQTPEVFQVFIQKCSGREWQSDTCASLIRTVLQYQAREAMTFLKVMGNKQIYSAFYGKNPVTLSHYVKLRDVDLFSLLLSAFSSNNTRLYVSNCEGNLFSLLKLILCSHAKENITQFFQLFAKSTWENIEKLFYQNISDPDYQRVLSALMLKAGSVLEQYPNIRLLTQYQAKKPINAMPGLPLEAYAAVETSLNQYMLQDCTNLVLDYACSEKLIFDLFRKSDMLAKIIRTEEKGDSHNVEFCSSLKDVNKRQTLRQKMNADAKQFKFVPFILNKKKEKNQSKNPVVVYDKGEIIRCRTKEESVLHKKNKTRTRTKATPMTLLSQCGHTALFGHHDEKRELVGYAFNLNEVKLKAMYSSDCGTFRRLWVGKNLQDVIAYANEIQAILFDDIDKFKQRIDEQPDEVNEVLAKLTPESVVAIVVGRDTAAARALAVTRQANYFQEFKRMLPMVFLNLNLRQMNVCVTESLEETKQRLIV